MDKTLYITREAHADLWDYIQAVSTEIGGFGFARRDEDGKWVWETTFIVPQMVDSGEVDYMEKGIPHAVEVAAEAGVLGQPDFAWVKWHSHNTMSAFFSGTDDQANKKLADAGISFLFDFVGNHDFEYKLRAQVYDCPLLGKIEPVAFDLAAYRKEPVPSHIFDEIEKYVTLRPKPKKVTYTHKHKEGVKQLPATTAYMGWDTMAWDLDDDTDDDIDAAELVEEIKDATEAYQKEHGLDFKKAREMAIRFGHPDDRKDVEADKQSLEWEEAGFSVIEVDGERFLKDGNEIVGMV